MAQSVYLWEGFKPSWIFGSAREMIVSSAYSRNLLSIMSVIGVSMIFCSSLKIFIHLVF